MDIVVDSQTQQLDLESIGIKGAALRHLRSLRLYVPRFYVLTSSFLESWAAQSGFAQKAQFAVENYSDAAELAREFSRLLAEFSLPSSLERDLDVALHDLEGQGSLRVVARPSRPYMSKIDSAQHLNLTDRAAVIDAIADIVREHFSNEAIDERTEKELPALHLKLPIVLQRFVVPDVTGIVMPYRDEHGFFYITAWKGFGFDMDFHRADHYLVNYHDLMLERFLNNTSGDVVFFSEEEGSITRTRILREEAKEPFLDHDQIIEMCKLYTENESDLGGLALEFKIRGQNLSFVSLKDAKIIEKAEQALDDLRSGSVPEAPVRPPADDEEASAPVEAAPIAEPASVKEPVHEPEQTTTEPAAHVGSAEPSQERTSAHETQPVGEPHAPEASAAPPPLEEEPVTRTEAESSDTAEAPENDRLTGSVGRVIEKYIAINPDLERQLRLLESDLLEELRK